ncbi:MAG: PhzF family phenazine biosynthesis protein [Rhodobacteraceae bacterium]|nr:PhzF family phenazine biosynthesis protein [Paracoccaceae bacterium]MCC5966633.1 PhzF family phenazine biosynthesis protein [Natronohydrobacter sp.]
MPDKVDLSVFVVDAFTDQPFAGNPAAVVPVPQWPEDSLMQSIAAEMNLSETAFIRPRPVTGWDLRWFAPLQEVDFCGHATLAAAHLLASEYGAVGSMEFHTRVGVLRVTRDGAALRLDIPALPPEPVTALPTALTGLFVRTPCMVFRNFENLFCLLDGQEAVRGFAPNMGQLAALGATGFCITAPGVGGVDFVSRYFAPGAGIPEDPVTGSTHATLVPFWAARLGRGTLHARQLSARGGILDCQFAGDRVWLTGYAVTVLRGTLSLPVTYPTGGKLPPSEGD